MKAMDIFLKKTRFIKENVLDVTVDVMHREFPQWDRSSTCPFLVV